MTLPVLEDILANRSVPEFQRALVQTTPGLAQAAMSEVAERHGAAWPRPARLSGALWRTNVNVVGGPAEADRRTLPVVDPEFDAVPEQGMQISQLNMQAGMLASQLAALPPGSSAAAALSAQIQSLQAQAAAQAQFRTDLQNRQAALPSMIAANQAAIAVLQPKIEQLEAFEARIPGWERSVLTE